jgi:manganese/zinc/iron transport system permease protein
MLSADVALMAGVAALAIALLGAFWKEFKLVAFDPDYARSLGLPVGALDAGLTVMAAFAIVVGLQMVGVVLMTAMLIAPAVAARQWTRSLGAMTLLSAGFGAAAGVAGALVSASARGVATGPVAVLAASAIVAVSLLAAPGRGIVSQALERARQRRSLEGRKVLVTLHGLSRAHHDPAYPAERGMIDAYLGAQSDRALARLEADGMIRPVAHAPEDTPHWELTPEGRAEARAALRDPTREDA